jgi:hypothetical protein
VGWWEKLEGAGLDDLPLSLPCVLEVVADWYGGLVAATSSVLV